MTILQVAVIVAVFHWALRVPREPDRERDLSRGSRR
jgi:hypothetical protein